MKQLTISSLVSKKKLITTSLALVAIFVFSQPSFAQEFKPSGKFWGYGFGDFFYKDGDTAKWASKKTYSSIPSSAYAFSFRRIYLGYDYNISPKFSASALLESSDAITTTGGDRTVFIKALYLKWKGIYKRADLYIGQQSTPSFSLMSEKVWSYRSIEKTIYDLEGLGRSSDMGVGLQGLVDSAGNYGYNVMYGNGSGTKPEDVSRDGRLKVFYGELYAYLLNKKVVIDLSGDREWHQNDKGRITIKAFVAYQSEPISVGLEVFSQTQQNAQVDTTDIKPFGISAWVRGPIIKEKLNFYVRWDSYNPNTEFRDRDTLKTWSASGMSKQYDEQLFIAGLDYTPHKNVHILPNIYYNTYLEKKETKLVVGREADITYRLSFYFVFK